MPSLSMSTPVPKLRKMLGMEYIENSIPYSTLVILKV